MALKSMANAGIVVDDLAATIAFFRELGLDRVAVQLFVRGRRGLISQG
jgi:catechol 2,3-dioxygenase-like lactoylglutathione lyase family enzyme